jgi:hypothetical protein
MIIRDQFKEREMKIEEYIKNEENIILFRNNVLLLKQDEMFEVLDVMENNDFKKLYESNIEEKHHLFLKAMDCCLLHSIRRTLECFILIEDVVGEFSTMFFLIS